MEQPKQRWRWKLYTLIVGSVIVLWGVLGWWLPGACSERGTSGAGLLGDSFGVVNSLFSGLAFAGVIIAILLQREELALQRQELELTRKELKRTAAAQEASEKALVTSAWANLAQALERQGIVSEQLREMRTAMAFLGERVKDTLKV